MIEMLNAILLTANHMYNCDQSLRNKLEQSPVEDICCGAKVTKITENSVIYEENGEKKEIPADLVVIASGFLANKDLEDQLWGKVKNLRLIGDAVAPRKIVDAVGEGFHYARLAK